MFAMCNVLTARVVCILAKIPETVGCKTSCTCDGYNDKSKFTSLLFLMPLNSVTSRNNRHKMYKSDGAIFVFHIMEL